jgi:hypothetical protein
MADAIEVRAVPDLVGGGGSWAAAVRAGPWIFLNGHEAFDFALGVPKEVAGRPGSRASAARAGAARATSSWRACAKFCASSARIWCTGRGSTSSTRASTRSPPITWPARHRPSLLLVNDADFWISTLPAPPA